MRRIEMRFALAVVLVGCHASSALQPPASPPRLLAVDLEAPRVTKIAINEGHVCALLVDGTVRCWGDNLEGELGDGTNVERHTPVVVHGVDHAVDIEASLAGACARIADGSVKCWGSAVFADELEHEPDGSVGWPGDATKNQAHPIALLAKASALWFGSIGDGCARWANGTMRCWGSGVGELAAGHPANLGNAPAPVVRALEHATTIAISDYLACATMADHTAMCWGQNDRHQIGDGTTEQRLQPTPVRGLRDVLQVVVGRESACALIAGGTVRCWGANDAGQLGDGTTTERATPIEVNGLRGATALFAGPLDVCAIIAGGAVTCWGWNRAGELGDGNTAEQSGPVTVAGLDHVRQIALALTHSCALRDSGQVYCWGNGWRGVIGDGLQASRSIPTPVRWTVQAPAASPLPANVSVTSVAVSSVHTCASLGDGSVRCWGRNDQGMVDARGGTEAYEHPTVVPGITNATSVALDGFESFARLADGHVVTWGRDKPVHDLGIVPAAAFVNGDGVDCTLRDHTATCLLFGMEPKKAAIANATQVVAGSMTACVLLADRSVACTGINNHGQVGDGTTTDRETFVRVPGVADATQLAIGDYQACARLGDGTITCWGDVEMTGNGGAIQTKPSPVTGLDGVVDLVAGPSSLCARKRDGSVACWGFYRPVSLGSGRDHWYSARPLDLPWLRGATMLVLGRNQSCAVLPAGLACWGKNDAGQLGDGTMDDRDEATPVRW